MNHRRPSVRGVGFTLVELLVVVAVIALLIAILIPALSAARRTAKRVTCGTNLKGIATAMHFYESANKRLPASEREYGGGFVNSGYTYYSREAEWDLRPMLADHLGGFELWTCPNLPGPTIDDPSNDDDSLFASYVYHGGGRLYPEFERTDRDENEPTPARSAHGGGSFPLIQDQLLRRHDGWQVNHGRGPLQIPKPTDNPSYQRILAPDRDHVDGANIAYYDGHVTWVAMHELVEVGYSHQAKTKPFYSTMPAGH